MTVEVNTDVPILKYGKGGLRKDFNARVKDELSKRALKNQYPEVDTIIGQLELKSIRAFRESGLSLPPEGTGLFVTFPEIPDKAIWEPVDLHQH